LPTLRKKICVSLPHKQKGGIHGQEESHVAAAAQPAVKKKWSGHKTAAKSSARKTIKSKATGVWLPRPSRSRRRGRSSASPSAITAKRISKADGLRTYAQYRDLGIADATHGLAQAHVIRLQGPCNPAEVSKLHLPRRRLPDGLCAQGLGEDLLEGQGETLMKEGSAWTQPPRIKHLIMDYSDDVELLEVILPAEFKTVEIGELALVASFRGDA
jgi:hypothetical protein